jgi:hypothetical protein
MDIAILCLTIKSNTSLYLCIVNAQSCFYTSRKRKMGKEMILEFWKRKYKTSLEHPSVSENEETLKK